jgi:REP element-mobilizing transposase RayT
MGMGSARKLDLTRRYKRMVNTTFHVTGHGLDHLQSFGTHRDKRSMIACLQRHLTHERVLDSSRHPYPKHHTRISLLAFCIMDNHYHLILHQHLAGGMAAFMHSALTGYSKYFNAEHARQGPLFRERYAAKPILDHTYAKRAVAYVHLNHEEKLLDYEHQSHDYYVGARSADWIRSDSGLAIFGGRDNYERYLERFGPDIIALKQARRESAIFGPGI